MFSGQRLLSCVSILSKYQATMLGWPLIHKTELRLSRYFLKIFREALNR
ncbi:MAG: hypothetical protein Fur0016_21490 [Anaerolineales bacterium]